MVITNRALVALSSAVSSLSLVFLTTGHAGAAPGLADQRTMVLSVEDITGYYYRSLKYWGSDDRTVELKRSNLSLAFATGGVRLGLHYFVMPKLSLGGSIGYENVSGSNAYQDDPGTWTASVPTENRLVIAPRVGYALMFTEALGFWFRGGLGYERTKRRAAEEGEYYSRDSFAMLSAEILFAWSPFPHFAMLIGPALDRSFVGMHYAHDPEGNWSNDSRLWRIGLTSGLAGYF